jgi:hypothetical protein
MRSAPAIAFDYRASHWLARAITAGVLAAIVAPWLSRLPAIACGAASLGTLLAGAVSLARFKRAGFRRIALRASGWTLVDTAGVEHTADLVAHVRLGPWLVLDFRSAGRRRFRAVLGPDNMDADTHRRLILLLSRAEVAQPG